ncbi:glycosyltransferase [Zobellia uliginosa]|uniref:glycosyltransferase n=1 Tax=Zobellia uliginosa TaxID=143224 RepID=UPI0026E271B9|nr:glycosyltransferase [Zobellia uliginosa]MDO6518281.1 glycosyltransferase [Zobellia uliginosa]
MKIGLLIYSLSGGGAERVMSYLLPYLRKQGYTVYLILMNPTISYDISDDTPIHYIERSKANESGIFKLLKLPFLAYKYRNLVKELEITHSFSMLTRPNYINILMGLFSRNRPKIIVSERGYPSMAYGYDGMQSKINNILIKQLYPKADLVIGNSMGNIKDLIDNYGVKKEFTRVIHNPLDVKKIIKLEPLNGFFDKSYFNMITVGRLNTGKNQELLIRAISKIPKARLYLMGIGPLEVELKNLVKNEKLSDRVFFLGFDNNPYKYLKSADLFVFASNHEGFPNVLLEAMCCGLPILTTNCKSGPNEIMKLKKNLNDNIMKTSYGILTPIKDLNLMIKGMKYFIENADYVESCKKNVLERVNDFEKESILKSYESALLKQ